MKILPVILIAVTTITLLLAQGCTKDVIVTTSTCDENALINYDDVRAILNSSCGPSGCHNPSGVNPDYTSWNEGMSASLTFDRFETQVFILKRMPLAGSTPLDSLESNKLKCWVEGGYQQ